MFNAIIFLLCVYALWPLYVFTMAMMRAHEAGQVSTVAWVLASPLIASMLILDVFLNFSAFAAITWDCPRMKVGITWVSAWKLKFPAPKVSGEWTFSQRLNRLVSCDGWRGLAARWVAASLLDPYDPSGKHIK